MSNCHYHDHIDYLYITTSFKSLLLHPAKPKHMPRRKKANKPKSDDRVFISIRICIVDREGIIDWPNIYALGGHDIIDLKIDLP